MKKISRLFLFGALTLIFLSAACASQQRGTQVAGTALPGGPTASPAVAVTETAVTAETSTGVSPSTTQVSPTISITQTMAIPVTGAGGASVICDFCVDDIPYAVLLLAPKTTFNMPTSSGAAVTSTPSPQAACQTIQVIHDKQVVVCTGPKLVSFNLNICTNGNCTEFPVKLRDCPASKAATEENTPEAGTSTATSPAATSQTTNTPLPVPTSTSTP